MKILNIKNNQFKGEYMQFKLTKSGLKRVFIENRNIGKAKDKKGFGCKI